jgi:nitrogen fixation NifU-like protein
VDELDGLVEELTRQIAEEERALYSARVIEHSHNPRNFRRLKPAKLSAVVRGWCGDTMEMYLRPDRNGLVSEAAFMTDGCGPTVACGSMLTSLVSGKPLQQALRITSRELIDALGGLPEESIHCAELAVATLRAAIGKRGGRDDVS